MVVEVPERPVAWCVGSPGGPLRVEGGKLLGSSKACETVQDLKADALVRCPQGDDPVDVVLRGSGCSLDVGVVDLDGMAHDEATHGVREEIDLWRRVLTQARRQCANEVDQVNEFGSIRLERAATRPSKNSASCSSSGGSTSGRGWLRE
jgi:hypothetical protein